MIEVDWRRTRLVIFDVDGTLYDQRRLRRRMVAELLRHCLFRPWKLEIPRLVIEFRKWREELAIAEAEHIATRQFVRPAARLGLEPEAARRIVEEWMLERPLAHLRRCRFPEVNDLFTALRRHGRTIAALSDYPAGRKLAALGLEVDICVTALDPEVDRLKPHPAGLLRVLELAGVAPEASLLIGDRDDRDGECARRAGVPFLLKSLARTSPRSGFTHYRQLLASIDRDAARGAALE